MTAVSPADVEPAIATDTSGIAGHPKGLMRLFFTEMWERFSYYGMRAFLLLFMVAPVESGGLGFSPTRAGVIYGTYTSMVYMLSVPGGWIADRFLGQQKAVLVGGILIMSGHVSLAFPAVPTFYLGLSLVALGTGLLKPNISAIVGQLYAPGDVRRDAGFTIFYMGINLGAFLAPLVCGTYLAESQSFKNVLAALGIAPEAAWHFAFGAAAVGMLFGLIQYVVGRRHLRGAGHAPTPFKDEAEASRSRMILAAVILVFVGVPIAVAAMGYSGTIELTPDKVGQAFDVIMPVTAIVVLGYLVFFAAQNRDERRRMIVVCILFFAAAVFWGCFEQAGSTLTLFADKNTDRQIFGFTFGATAFQSLNAILVFSLAPLFAWLWLRLGERKKEPITITKFGLGLIGVAAGFLIMVPAAKMVLGGSLVGPQWLTLLYVLHTCGELCLSPVGLSAMTKLAPARLVGLIMGVWFLAASMGNYMAGRAVGLKESMSMDSFFLVMVAIPVAFAIVLFLIAKPVQRMLDRSHTEVAAGH